MLSLAPISFSRKFFDPFEDFNSFFSTPATTFAPATFGTDIRHADGKFTIEMDVPGFSKDDIQLEVKNDILKVVAERKQTDEVKTDDGYVRRGRFSGRVEKSFDISGIDAEGITAGYENGVLTIDLPEKKVVEPEAKKIFIA